MPEHYVTVRQFQPEHGSRQDVDDDAFSNNRLFFGHRESGYLMEIWFKINPTRERSQSLASLLMP